MEILVLALQSVWLRIIELFVHVQVDCKVIHLSIVTASQFHKLNAHMILNALLVQLVLIKNVKTLALKAILVPRMLNVEYPIIDLCATVLPDGVEILKKPVSNVSLVNFLRDCKRN